MIDIETQQEMKPDRVVDGEEYFSVNNAAKYWGMSRSGFRDYLNRVNISRWNIPRGSRNVYIKKSDLDEAFVPVVKPHVS